MLKMSIHHTNIGLPYVPVHRDMSLVNDYCLVVPLDSQKFPVKT